ncbi:mitochondrial ribosome-associated GTPase 1-like isoform X2 [Liolophura sinensis]
MKQIEMMLKNVDCVVEVHDARIPFSGRNPNFRNALMLRPHLLVLNKVDLADMTRQDKVEELLQQQGVNSVVYTNCKEQTNTVVKKKLIPKIKDLIGSRSRYHREESLEYNLLIIGIPNVGKSSLINSLRRTHLKKGKATRVGGIAGITRSVLERIKVCEEPAMYLYDTPGILAPNVQNVEVGMKLALSAALQDHLVGVDSIADYMLYTLNKKGNYSYVKYFGLEDPTDDVLKLLAHVALKNNKAVKLRSPGSQTGYVYRPHFDAAAGIVLRAFREGKLGLVMLDDDILDSSQGR